MSRMARVSPIGWLILLPAASTMLLPTATAGPLTPGNLVVVRIGDGTVTLGSAAQAVWLDEYTTAGVLVQSIPLPTVVSGPHRRLTLAGNATTEGALTLSRDERYLLLAGYDAAPGTSAVSSTAASVVNRVIARIGLDGNIDTTTAFQAYSGANIRSAASVDGWNFWSSGNSTAAAHGGVRFTTLGSTSLPVQLAAMPTNTRVIDVALGRLFVTAQFGAFTGLNTVGASLPVSAGQTISSLPGFTAALSGSPLDFAVASVQRVYLVSDTAPSGLQRWELSAGTWTRTGLLGVTSPYGAIRAFTMDPASDPPVFYAVTAPTMFGSSILTTTDLGGRTIGTWKRIVRPGDLAAGAYTFRGIRLIPARCDVTLDGVAERTYGVPLATQVAPTRYANAAGGDTGCANGSELDQAFGFIRDGALHLTIAGNLESNGNRLNLFFDAQEGAGQNRLRGDNPTIFRLGTGGGGGGPGLRFDANFAPDYWIGVNLVCSPGFALHVDYVTLPTAGPGVAYDLGTTSVAGVPTVLSGGSAPFSVEAALNNYNPGGVTDLSADQAGQVVTGVELRIPLEALGLPAGPVRVCAFVSSPDYAGVSNQVLGPLAPVSFNYPDGSFRDFESDMDASGPQWFTVPVRPSSSPPLSCAISAPSEACAGDVFLATAKSSAPETVYDWVVEGGVILAGQGTDRVQVQPAAGARVTLHLTVSRGSETCEADTEVIVLPAVEPPSYAAAAPAAFCPFVTSELTLSASGGAGKTLAWYRDGCGGELVGTGSPLMVPVPDGPTTYFARWEGACGLSSCIAVSVEPAANTLLRVAVELSPLIVPGPLTRCVTFELLDSTGCAPPTTLLAELTFVDGLADAVVLTVPCAAYDCVTARDARHTLRRTAPLTASDGEFVAEFRGPRRALVGGNLDDSPYIDIVDFAIYLTLYLRSYGGGAVRCDLAGWHADINGDGLVNTLDFGFIYANFLASADPGCCDAANAPKARKNLSPAAPQTYVSVAELLSRGLGQLRAADLNADGLLDIQDLAEYLAGRRP